MILEQILEDHKKWVEIVSSNLRLKDGRLEFDYRKPFDLLALGDDFEKWRTLVPEYRTYVLRNSRNILNNIEYLKAA